MIQQNLEPVEKKFISDGVKLNGKFSIMAGHKSEILSITVTLWLIVSPAALEDAKTASSNRPGPAGVTEAATVPPRSAPLPQVDQSVSAMFEQASEFKNASKMVKIAGEKVGQVDTYVKHFWSFVN